MDGKWSREDDDMLRVVRGLNCSLHAGFDRERSNLNLEKVGDGIGHDGKRGGMDGARSDTRHDSKLVER